MITPRVFAFWMLLVGFGGMFGIHQTIRQRAAVVARADSLQAVVNGRSDTAVIAAMQNQRTADSINISLLVEEVGEWRHYFTESTKPSFMYYPPGSDTTIIVTWRVISDPACEIPLQRRIDDWVMANRPSSEWRRHR